MRISLAICATGDLFLEIKARVLGYGVVPDAKIEQQNELPGSYGVGLTDVGLVPGNDANAFGKRQMLKWSEGLFARLDAHQRRAGGPPAFVAFTGVRQFRMLFPDALSRHGRLECGEQQGIEMPAGWPFPADSTRIWVLPSSSGRAVMTHEQRIGPYRDLAVALRLHFEPAEPAAQSASKSGDGSAWVP